jgi:hypothetical protein
MRRKVSKRLREAAFDIYNANPDKFRHQFQVYKELKREHTRARGRQFPKLQTSKRQQRLAEKRAA